MSDISTFTGQEFVGHWIGETMGADSPAHLWEILRSNNTLIIKTRWEGEAVQGGHFSAKAPDQNAAQASLIGPSFELRTGKHTCTVVLVDPQHFIIRGWDTNDVRDNEGPDYDVVFSRPGIAELQAQAVWQQFKDQLPEPQPFVKLTREQEAAQHWRGMTRSMSQPPSAKSVGGSAGTKARRKAARP